MKILANTNNMMTAQNLELYFRNSGIDASAVWASASAEMIGILRHEKIDILLYFAQKVNNGELINFFFDAYIASPAAAGILCIDAANRSCLNDNLIRCVDECITLPLSPADFTSLMQRCQRRSFGRKAGGAPAALGCAPLPASNAQTGPSKPGLESEPPADKRSVPDGVLPGKTASAPAENLSGGIPPAQAAAPNVSNAPAMPQNPVTQDVKAGSVPAGPAGGPFSSPGSRAEPAAHNAANEVPRAAFPVPPPGQPGAAVPPSQTGPVRKKREKVKSPLRNLRKSELHKIILEQEKKLELLNRTVEELNGKLESLI